MSKSAYSSTTGPTGNKNSDSLEMSVGTPDSTPVSQRVSTSDQFVCPICGKSFDSFNALRGHSIRVHRTKLVLNDEGKVRVYEGKEKKKEKLPKKYEEVEELPDERANLETLLRKHGVRNSNVIADLMTHRSWDDLYSLTEYLRLSRVPSDKILLIIEDWANHRRIPIPEDLLTSLNVPPSYVPPPAYSYRGYSHPRYEDEHKGIDATTLLVSAQQQLTEVLKAVLENREASVPSNYNDTSLQENIRRLEEENKELRSRLEKQERDQLRDEIKSLRDEVRQLRSGQNQLANQYTLGIETIRSIKEIILTGMQPVPTVRKPPKREELLTSEPSEKELTELGVPIEEAEVVETNE